MAQRDYGQFFHAAHAGQVAVDDWRQEGPLHPLFLTSQFTIYWIPSENSAAIAGGQIRTIFSFGEADATNIGGLSYLGGSGIRMTTPGGVTPQPITFTAGMELRFDVDGVAGTVEVTGALTGDGVYTGDEWSSLLDETTQVRIGGNVASDGLEARGWVSLPYARIRTPLLDEFGVAITDDDSGDFLYDG